MTHRLDADNPDMEACGVAKSTILAALSRALDLVEGQPEGHAVRTANIAVALGAILGLNDEQREDLYYAALLKDSGCSNNSVRIHKIFGGDEHLTKRAVKFVDWSSSLESIKFAWHHTESGRTLGAKLRRMAANLGPPNRLMNEVTEARCTRGAAIASKLNFRPAVAETILYLDEHWNGKGAPYGKKGTEIPLLSRILSFAQTFEVFVLSFGIDSALEMARDRSKKWFDSEVVAASKKLADQHGFWPHVDDPRWALNQMPWLDSAVIASDIDAICEAFAMIIDAKSSFTSEHSTRVMQYSKLVANELGFSQGRIKNLARAALLHDLGKLGVSTGILEKPAKLENHEFDAIKRHPQLGGAILGAIPGFEYAAEIASCHHERLDGKGYWRGLTETELSKDVRIVTVCDVFDALSAKRPYRDALPLEKVFEIMSQDIGSAFDAECFYGLKNSITGWELPAAA